MPTILIADDDAPSRGAYTMILRMAGYDVCPASDGDEALQVLRERAVDLVVLDLAMPCTDGLAVLRALQNNPDWSGIPVVVITALPEPDAARHVSGLGVTSILIKSRFSRRDLLGRIDHALARPAVV